MLKRQILVCGIAIALSATAVAAQDVLRQNQRADELRGDWVIGTTVRTPAGETVGTIEDLIISKEDGSVTAAIVSVGGFLGIGAKNIAVKWDKLNTDFDAAVVRIDLTRQAAEEAPEFAFREPEPPPTPGPEAQPEMGTGTGTTPTPTQPGTQ